MFSFSAWSGTLTHHIRQHHPCPTHIVGLVEGQGRKRQLGRPTTTFVAMVFSCSVGSSELKPTCLFEWAWASYIVGSLIHEHIR